MDLPRRGPDAFNKLVEALNEAGNWNLITLLDRNHYLNVKPQEFVSLSESRVNGNGYFIFVFYCDYLIA